MELVKKYYDNAYRASADNTINYIKPHSICTCNAHLKSRAVRAS